MRLKVPSDDVLEKELASAVREIFHTEDRDILSVNLVRKRVTDKFALEDGFFSDAKWKNRSKTLIKDLVNQLIAQDEGGGIEVASASAAPSSETTTKKQEQPKEKPSAKEGPTTIIAVNAPNALATTKRRDPDLSDEEFSAKSKKKGPAKKARRETVQTTAKRRRKDVDSDESDEDFGEDEDEPQPKAAATARSKRRRATNKASVTDDEEDQDNRDNDNNTPTAQLGDPSERSQKAKHEKVAQLPRKAIADSIDAKHPSNENQGEKEDKKAIEEDEEEEEAKSEIKAVTVETKETIEAAVDDSSELSSVVLDDDTPPPRKKRKGPPATAGGKKTKDSGGRRRSSSGGGGGTKGGHANKKKAATIPSSVGTAAATAEGATVDPREAEIKKLQSWLTKCGVRKIWGFELRRFGDDWAAKERHLRQMLRDVGMGDGRFSEARARDIRERRELEADLEAVIEMDRSWGLSGGGRRGSLKDVKSQSRASRSRASGGGPGGDNDDDDDDNDDEHDERGERHGNGNGGRHADGGDDDDDVVTEKPFAKSRTSGPRAVLAFLGDESESD